MSKVSEIMSPNPQVIGPEDTLQRAARMMQELDVGALPVCNGKQVLGMVTDRDIAIRGVAAGLKPDTACVSDIMTRDIKCASEAQDSDEVMRLLSPRNISISRMAEAATSRKISAYSGVNVATWVATSVA